MTVETAESRLLHPASTGERAREGNIQNWLYDIGIRTVDPHYPTVAGPVDLYLPNRRVLIEVKNGGRLKNGPRATDTGSPNEGRPHESAYEQIQRYVLAERKRERLYLDEDITDFAWLGVVTDSSRWWVWEWPPAEQGDTDTPNHAWQRTRLTRHNIGQLARLFSRTVGKEWAPTNPYGLFEGALQQLEELYEMEKDVPATMTQRGLWLQQLEAGGNAPAEDIDLMFVRHTLLILITRMITSTITGENDVATGFVQWVPKDSDFIRNLQGIVDNYNWRQRSTDILRSLYDGFIPQNQRKLFGEYYTPDWLAEYVCKKVINEGYIKAQIVNYRSNKPVMGVLDPCCGSGTFLVHAIKRIQTSKSMAKSGLSEHQKTVFLTQMIHGIDIHPVAVEMARVNVLRLIPAADQASIQIYQGDSMLIARPESAVLSVGGENMFLESPRGTPLVIPKNFLRSNDDIGALVKSAKDSAGLPPGLGAGLDEGEVELLREAHRTLTKIIEREQNSIWYWYIINQAAPILLREKKVGRIISNPPWVSLQEIRNVQRKAAIMSMAREKKLYVGKETAGRFDIAMLAVHRCMSLYLRGNRAGWVLPQGAILGAGNWNRLAVELSGSITDELDWGRLPFPNTPTCTILTGKRDAARRTKYRKRPGEPRIASMDGWDVVKGRLEASVRPVFADRPSEYVGRHGASLQPKCLVRVATEARKGKNIQFATEATFKDPWKRLGSRSGTVPSRFVRDTISSGGMFPFHAVYGVNVIPILDNGEWDPARMQNEYWKMARSLYERNKGGGGFTPKTLEASLDHLKKLTSQLVTGYEHRVAYNTVGDYLYAAVIPSRVICGRGIVAVHVHSLKAALFLSGLLNASCLHNAFVSAQRTDRNFDLHVLNRRPLPQFDFENDTHQEIVRISAKCETFAKTTYDGEPGLGDFAMRAKIRNALYESGLQRQLYDCIRTIMPDYADWKDASTTTGD